MKKALLYFIAIALTAGMFSMSGCLPRRPGLPPHHHSGRPHHL